MLATRLRYVGSQSLMPSSFASCELTMTASFVPIMNTTASGSRASISSAAYSCQSRTPGSKPARDLVVDVRVDDARGAGDIAERGSERAGERIATDPEAQRLGVRQRPRP